MTPSLLVAWVFLQAGESRPDERERWLPPLRTVTLERGERTVGETLKAIREQTGLEVQASGVNEGARITTDWKERPVLEALDDVCRALGAGSVRVNDGAKEKGPVELDGEGKRSPSVCHWRQFRVDFVDASVTTVRSLESTKRTASLSLSWTAQPGTHPLSVEEFRPEEIVDDAGWSLLSREGGNYRRRQNDEVLKEGEDPNVVIRQDRFSDRETSRNVQIEIQAPSPEAKTIDRLKGRLYMTFPMRFVEQSIPAAEMVPGKEIRIGALTVQVVKFEQRGEKLTFVYKMTQRGGQADFSSAAEFELKDEKGNQVNRGYSARGSEDGYTIEYMLSNAHPVVQVHHQAYVGRITLAIPVELRGLPLPVKGP